jgi:transcriptional regulator with XRE-family HTH domain
MILKGGTAMDQILKKALKERELSQKEFAELIHVTPQAVSKWLNGESRPSQDNVILIFETLGIDLTKEMVLQNSRCRKKGMEMTELQELDSFEKAKKESAFILERVGIKHKYSYPVYVLLSWLLPAVIGLTYHQSLNSKDDDEIDSGFIACNLKDYLDEECLHKKKGLYANHLEYNFYLLGMDLFESFDEYRLKDHDYCSDAMASWSRFSDALIKSPTSPIYCELRVAISEIVDLLEGA